MDYEIDELTCPHCGVNTHSRRCTELMCEGGLIDDSEEDYLLPGTNLIHCQTCHGTGVERWCPKCGEDLGNYDFHEEFSDSDW